MKNGQNLRDLQDKRKAQVEEAWIHQPVCMVCNKSVEGFYARFGTIGVCNRECMKVQDAKPKYEQHTEKEFLKRFNL